MLKLVYPSEEYKDSFLEALQEYHAYGEKKELNVAELERNFSGFLKQHENFRHGVDIPDGKVPSTLLWLAEGINYIGRISIRHRLNVNLEKYGGHLGYSIRPLMRNKGYGRKMIKMAMPRVRKLGLSRILITTTPKNIASKKIIEAIGGVFWDEINFDNEHPRVMRYWVDVDKY